MNSGQNSGNLAGSCRLVLCEDAIGWLEREPIEPGRSSVVSLPDLSEYNGTLEQWRAWFIDTAALVLCKTPDSGVAIFYQSDIRIERVWVDKGFLCQKAAERTGHSLIWHKIMSRVPPGTATAGRPSYTHALCFSRSFEPPPSYRSPDILADIGEKSWEPGMGLEAALFFARFISEQVGSKEVVNPFCGHGSMLAAANAVGLSAIGIERSPKRAEIARALRVSRDFKRWEGEPIAD